MRIRNTILCLATALALSAAVFDRAFAQSAELAEALSSYETLYQQGKYYEAEAPAQEALRLATAEFGPDDPRTATHMDNLGVLYHSGGRYADAETILLGALEIQEKALGPDHLDVARSLNHLAELYTEYEIEAELPVRVIYASGGGGDLVGSWQRGSQGYAAETGFENQVIRYFVIGKEGAAEPLYQRALAIREKALGPDHPDVAESLSNLGNYYGRFGDHEKAERLINRALAMREKALGPKHPDVAESLSHLALFYDHIGSYKGRKLFLRSLRIRKKAFGPVHPLVAQNYEEMANLREGFYGLHGKGDYLRALSIWKKTGGPDHPRVAMLLNAVAVIYTYDGLYSRAKPLLLHSLEIRERVFGPEHPAIAAGLNNLAILYYATRKYKKAEPLFQRALAIREKTLSSHHSDLAKSLENYAALLRATGRKAEAKEMQTRAEAMYAFRAQYRIGKALLLKGKPAAALAAMQKETSEGWRLVGLVMAHHALGDAAASDAALAELIEKHEKDWAYNIAYVLAFRGEADRAFEWLKKAVTYKDPGLSEIASQPLFANIQSDPRWLPFLESIG